MKFFYLTIVIFLLSACAKDPNRPQDVPVRAIQTILVSDSLIDSDVCANELRVGGAEILYKNEMGVVMTSAPISALPIEHCEADISVNRTEPFRNVTDETKAPSLSTLLKLIPAEEIGARTFIQNNPEFDGRGVIIGVLDTGVEIDHPMLAKTSTGEAKVIDFQDFSGEGKLDLDTVTVDINDIFKGTDGGEYFVRNVGGSDYRFALFRGSSLKAARRITRKDEFSDLGVITYLKGGKHFLRIDTNGDRDFGNDTELSDFSENHQFVKLGKKKSLTTSVNIGEAGKTATICFDDGSHGTHVAGIAAGFDSDGLQGVAPGAKVIAVKIGDNRLAGGSTTTASKMLAIDYAVEKGARVLNISYGIRAGSDLGKSAIDKYVDKVAKEKNVLFAISAGNEGPGIQTIGTPAGADRALTVGAYISKETAPKQLRVYWRRTKQHVVFFQRGSPKRWRLEAFDFSSGLGCFESSPVGRRL